MKDGAPTDQHQDPVGLEARTYNAFVAGLDLEAIDVVKVNGERLAAGSAAEAKFDLDARYSADQLIVRFRYHVTAQLTDKAGNDLAQVVAAVMITARTDSVPEAPCIERFGATSGALIAHPYLRETIASTAQRLGFNGVLLPIIKQEPESPGIAEGDRSDGCDVHVVGPG